jgi:hypothetical protein
LGTLRSDRAEKNQQSSLHGDDDRKGGWTFTGDVKLFCAWTGNVFQNPLNRVKKTMSLVLGLAQRTRLVAGCQRHPKLACRPF